MATRVDEIFSLVKANDATYIPNYTLGGVQITCPEGFIWRFTAGVRPFMTTYVDFDKNINAIYEAAGGETGVLPISFEYKIYMLSTSGISFFQGKIPNLFVIERRIERRQGISSLLITDARFWLKNIQYPARFNMKRRVPKNKVLEDLPRKLKDVFGLPQWMYYPDTLNNGKPWTAFQIADALLRPYLAFYKGSKGALGKLMAFIGGPQPDDQDLIGIKATDAIEANLLRARMNVGMFPDGNFYTFFLDDHFKFLEYLAQGGLTIAEKEKHINPSSGALFYNSLWKQRTDSVNIGFYREYECLFEFNTSFDTSNIELAYTTGDESFYIDPHDEDGENINASPKPAKDAYSEPLFELQHNKLSLHGKLMNVAPAPFLMTVDGKEIAPGSYLPISKFFEEWNIDEQDILDYWFGHHWKWGLLVEEFKTSGVAIQVIMSTPEYRAKVNLVTNHWSQTFQVDPNFMKTVDTLKAKRTMIIDSVSNTSLPSLVWTNCTAFPNIYPPLDFMKQYGIDVAEMEMGQAIIHAPMGESINDVIKNKISDFTVNLVPGQEKAGIIHISAMQDAHGVNYQLVHRDAVAGTLPPVGKQRDPRVFMNTKLNPEWRLVVLMTCTFLVPNNRKQMHWEKQSALTHNTRGNPTVAFEKITRATVARHEIDTDGEEDVILSVNKDPSNKKQLVAVAQSEAEVYYHQMADRLDGHETYNGIYPIPLFANVGSISYNFAVDGVTTHISAEQIPPSQDPMDKLPKDLRRRLRRWLPLES